MANYLAGFSGSATLGSSSLCVTKWDATENNTLLDVTSTCSSGKMQFIKGLSGVDVNLTANYDGTSPPTVAAGDSIAVVLDAGSGTEGFACTTCLVASKQISLDVAGLVTYTLTLKSSGPYTFPTT